MDLWFVCFGVLGLGLVNFGVSFVCLVVCWVFGDFVVVGF